MSPNREVAASDRTILTAGRSAHKALSVRSPSNTLVQPKFFAEVGVSTIRYVFGVLTVVGVPPAIVWWYLVHPFVGFWRRVGARGTLWTVGALMVGAMVGLWFVRDPLVGRDLGTHWALAAVGFALIVVAAYLGMKRKRFLTLRILAGVPELSDTDRGELLTEGPYAHVRHPRYVEVVFGMVGYALVANHAGVYLVVLLCLPVLHGVVVLEERELAERFGAAWAEYRARVPRYVPRWWPRRPPAV